MIMTRLLSRLAAGVASVLLAGACLVRPSLAHAFSQALPTASTIPQGRIAERARQAQRLAPAQPLGGALPLDTALADQQGKAVLLRDYFGQGPVVLVLGYYRCPNLCGTVMQGVLEALAATGLPTSDWRIVYVSVDPTEDASIAAERRESWMSYFHEVAKAGSPGHPDPSRPASTEPLRLDTLTGSQDAVVRVANAAGFAVEPDTEPGSTSSDGRTLSRYAHPSEFMVATPQGRLSRFVFGVRFDARDVRLALVDAGNDKIGGVADRLLLLCSHFDPATGRYDSAVMNVLRATGLLFVSALGVFAWRSRHAGRAGGAVP